MIFTIKTIIDFIQTSWYKKSWTCTSIVRKLSLWIVLPASNKNHKTLFQYLFGKAFNFIHLRYFKLIIKSIKRALKQFWLNWLTKLLFFDSFRWTLTNHMKKLSFSVMADGYILKLNGIKTYSALWECDTIKLSCH